MLAPKFIPLVIKHIVRHPTRSLLTVAGVAVAMFLFCTVQSMQEGVEAGLVPAWQVSRREIAASFRAV